MLKTPPHILRDDAGIAVPAAHAERSRADAATAQIVIVDEIHAVLNRAAARTWRCTLERLDARVRASNLCSASVFRRRKSRSKKSHVSWSACNDDRRRASIVDRGHKRKIDLAIEVPAAPLEAVMSTEVWTKIYQRLDRAVSAHRTTLIFVNTRRLAERMAHQSQRAARAKRTSLHITEALPRKRASPPKSGCEMAN